MLYLGIGTNIGDRLQNIESAYELISKHIGKIFQKSSIWESEPWGYSSPNKFYNAVCSLETNIPITELIREITYIEKKIGRIKTFDNKYEDRIIDIDILAINNKIICCENLKVPHPKLHQRLFVLLPLKEVAPAWIHPVFGLTVEELIKQCDDKIKINCLNY